MHLSLLTLRQISFIQKNKTKIYLRRYYILIKNKKKTLEESQREKKEIYQKQKRIMTKES